MSRAREFLEQEIQDCEEQLNDIDEEIETCENTVKDLFTRRQTVEAQLCELERQLATSEDDDDGD